MKKLVALLMVFLLAACQTTPAPQPQVRVIDTACSWVKELTISAKDTEETKRQVIEHDKAVRKNCPKKQ